MFISIHLDTRQLSPRELKKLLREPISVPTRQAVQLELLRRGRWRHTVQAVTSA